MNERQQRFLTAYSACLTVAEAARMARIHRTKVYRWKADPAFVEEMNAAWQAGYQRWYQAVYLPQAAARKAPTSAEMTNCARCVSSSRPLSQHLRCS
jgi:hypothetical protein